ncbi:MAG: sulfurtransferase TusA family protein [Chloroflexi bacterium]|nr:sulfurtransferase TusA family protein [Chloroflexota bacterium]
MLPPADRELDLRGEVCPYTFIKTKLMLEQMQPGQVLRVIVDYEPAVHNIPRNLRAQGQDTMDVRALEDGQWAITVRVMAECNGG